MRVLMVMEYFRPYVSGVVVSIENSSRELLKLGHTVGWLYPEGSIPSVENVECFEGRSIRGFTRLPTQTLLPTVSELRALVCEFRPEVVHAHGLFASLLAGKYIARLAECCLVVTLHTMLPEYTHYTPVRLPGAKTALSKWVIMACRIANLVIVPSNFAASYVRILGFAGSLTVLPTGVDLELFRPASGIKRGLLRKKYDIEQDMFVVLLSGRLTKEKSIVETLRELRSANLPSLRILLAGGGPLRDEIRRNIKQLGIESQVRMLGEQDLDGMAELYQSVDCFVHMSETEFQGLVVLEAMASGLPVLVPEGSAQAENITNGYNGITVPGINGKFQEALTKCAESKSVRAFLGTNARRSSLNLGNTPTVKRLESEYLRLIL